MSFRTEFEVQDPLREHKKLSTVFHLIRKVLKSEKPPQCDLSLSQLWQDALVLSRNTHIHEHEHTQPPQLHHPVRAAGHD